jgi:hypothetical protein
MAHIVRAVASQRAQVRPALISAADLQLVREFYPRHLERFESELETQPRQDNLCQATTNCRSALSYIYAIAFDPTTIDKGIVTALLDWLRYSRDITETSVLDSASICDGLPETVQEILLALQTR